VLKPYFVWKYTPEVHHSQRKKNSQKDSKQIAKERRYLPIQKVITINNELLIEQKIQRGDNNYLKRKRTYFTSL
jgi:hypothetical protein